MGRIHGDLVERTLNFGSAILDFLDLLPNKNKGWIVSRQLGKCGTSVGANVHEADQAISTAEFRQKCSIALKEASETQYWLRLCERNRLVQEDPLRAHLNEVDQLIRILATIVKNTQSHD